MKKEAFASIVPNI